MTGSITVRVEEPAGVKRIVGKEFVSASMQSVRSGLRGVLDKSAAGVAILRSIGGGDDLHFLNALDWRRAFLTLLVSDGITEGCAIKEILCGHRLPAINAGVELAAAEHWVAVWLHGKIAGLNLKDSLRQANIRRSNGRNILIVLLVDDVADIGSGDVQFRTGSHLDRLGDRADGQSDVFADRLCTLQSDPRTDGLLEACVIDGHRIGTERQRRRCECTSAVGGQRSFERSVLIPYFDFGPCDRRTGRIRYDAGDNSAI